MTIPVLFDRSGVIAVVKPTGLASQAPPGIVSVESLMRERLFGDAFQADLAAGRRRHPGGFLGMPHRLDRAVSGVLLMATTPRAARQLSRQFEQRTIDKAYLAVVTTASQPTTLADPFEWRDLIRKVPDEPRAEIVAGDITGAREAITEGHLLTAESDRLLLSLSPRTGRMHQLRLQAAARGMPIVGDTLYGGRPSRADATDCPPCLADRVPGSRLGRADQPGSPASRSHPVDRLGIPLGHQPAAIPESVTD